MHPNTHHHGGTYDDDRGSHDDVRRNCAFDRRNFDHHPRFSVLDHTCTTHDDCTLVHRRHRSTGWWFQYHEHASGVVLAVDHDGTTYGHAAG